MQVSTISLPSRRGGSLSNVLEWQDCILDRIQLCARKDAGSATWAWFDFAVCRMPSRLAVCRFAIFISIDMHGFRVAVFRNQAETDMITDGLARFNQTVEYCASLEGLPLERLWGCAVSNDGRGAELLLASHKAAAVRLPISVSTLSWSKHVSWIVLRRRLDSCAEVPAPSLGPH